MQFNFIYISRIGFWSALTGSYVIAVMPHNIAPHVGSLSDKLIHFLTFTLLTILLRLAYKVNRMQSFLLLLLYGILIEASQYFTSSRSSEFLDVGADIIGIGIGLFMYQLGIFVIKYENYS